MPAYSYRLRLLGKRLTFYILPDDSDRKSERDAITFPFGLVRHVPRTARAEVSSA